MKGEGNMARLFYCTFNRSREIFYDGLFLVYDDGKIVGYTHDGILTGAITSKICETNQQCYIDYPINEEFISDGIQLNYQHEKGNIIIKLYERSYDHEIEERILERTWERARKLPESVQNALEKFLEAGEADT